MLKSFRVPLTWTDLAKLFLSRALPRSALPRRHRQLHSGRRIAAVDHGHAGARVFHNATYGTIGGVIVTMLWFYVSSLAVLVGAELNAEIEHASPYGKEPGEKVSGEKKKVGT